MADEPVGTIHTPGNDPEVSALVATFRARKERRAAEAKRGHWDQDPMFLAAEPDPVPEPPPLHPDDPLLGDRPPTKPWVKRSLKTIARSTATKTALIPDLLYPGAWLLVGRPKIGKSWLELQLALAMGSGNNFMDWPIPAPCRVLYIAAEDDEPRLKSRLDIQCRAGAPETVEVMLREDIKSIAGARAREISLFDWLDQYLTADPAICLVILDTEMAVLQIWHGEAEGRQSNSAIESDYLRTSAFDDIGLRHNAAIMLANHAAKRKGDVITDFHELINRTNTAFAGVTGSMVLADLPDADLHDPKVKERILAIRCRDLAEDQLWTIKQDTDAVFTKVGPYTEVRQTEAEKEVMETLESLMTVCDATGYVTASEIADQMGKQRAAVKRTISRMVDANRTVWGKYRFTAKPGLKGGCRLDPL